MAKPQPATAALIWVECNAKKVVGGVTKCHKTARGFALSTLAVRRRVVSSSLDPVCSKFIALPLRVCAEKPCLSLTPA
jgi:hypothetical protein